MADAPKAQRQRRRRNAAGTSSATPTAETSPSGPAGAGPRPRRRNRRARRARVRPVVEGAVVITGPRPRNRRINRAVKRELRREGLEGPKVSVQQKITATFGLVRPNTSGNIELELNFFLHPALAKEANDGTAFGPLQALAAQYSLWRLKYLMVRFTPMVGASAVSGTVVRASLNLSQSPGVSNWSGLGARMHLDMHPGQTTTFHLRADQVAGPRDGGWWFTDTNEEGSQSAGPIVEIHTMGETKSTFRDDNWTGPLFLVEGIGMWQFANYNVKPALGSLERREGDAKVQVKATASQPITMVLDSADTVAVFMDSIEPESAAVPTGQTVGETIFQIVDVGANVAQKVSPPPFGWLIKGGWWFVKKLLGRTRDGTSEFVVYASLQDAQNNKPAIATGSMSGETTSPIRTNLMVTQINTPNVGPNPHVTGSPRGGPQNLRPGQTFRVHAQMITELFIKIAKGAPIGSVSVPVSAIPGVVRDAATGSVVQYPSTEQIRKKIGFVQTPWWIGVPGKAPGNLIPADPGQVNDTEYLPTNGKGGYVHSLYRLHDPRFTDQYSTIEYNPPVPGSDNADFAVLSNFGGGTLSDGVYTPGNGEGKISQGHVYEPYGKVVATTYVFSGTNPSLDMVFSLIYITKGLTFGGDNVRDLIIAVGTDANKVAFTMVPTTTESAANKTWNLFERDIPAGTWLLGVGYTNAVGTANGANTTTNLRFDAYSRVENTTSALFPYNLAGQMLPATSMDMLFKYVEYTPPSQALIEQLRDLGVSYVLPPYLVEESGNPGPSSDGEGGGLCVPCVLPPPPLDPIPEEDETDEDDDSDTNSVERFVLELGNDMISMPRRWLNDPEFSRFLDM